MSAKEATKKFNFFDFQTYFNMLSFDAEPAVRQKMQKEDFNFVLMEPDQLAKLGAAMSDGNEFGFTPNQLLNYLYFRVMRDNINNIPYPEDQVKVVSDNVLGYKLYHPNLGRPKYLEVDKYIKEDDPVTNEELNCALQVLFSMDMASSRVYLDHAFPLEKRARVRQGAQIVLNGILLGFRSMVEQISWMSPLAKQGAFDKMDNIVTNVGYPDFVTNNTQLEDYYKDLKLNSLDNFVTSMEKITTFNYKQQFGYLAKKRVMRDEFGSSNVLVNAWYQPQVNSITLPAAILQPPFFDPDWPAAVNFGSLGVVVGHELTHGFDDQGVQWDGVGALNTWLDASSRQAFDQMANCIVQEYNGFCPLDPDQYQPNCLNGFNTQGENIADNGGIHAAFRAYRNRLEVHGPDRALPSDLIGQFTHDQLFFLSFAQPWCMEQQEPEDTYSQILFDPHSPAKYRILGTLRNFPAFRDAFNCPVNAVYAPENHCEVWITDISTKPLPSLPANQINVAVPKTVRADDREFSTYRNAFNYFKASVNFSYNPCENFYEYACGSYKNKLSFTVSRDDNYRKLANILENLEYHPSTAVQKLKSFYDLCTITYNELYSDDNNGADYLKGVILAKVQKFSEASQLQMTIFEKSRPADIPVPSPDTLATAMAYLSIKEGINTLVTPYVDVELVKQAGPQVYKLFLDQNTLVYPKSYYQPGAWEVQQPKYFTNAMEMLKRYAVIAQKKVDEKSLASYVNKLMALEVMLARAPYSTEDTVRRNFSRWDNMKTLEQANQDYGFVNWITFFDKISNYTDVDSIKQGSLSSYTAYFTEDSALKQLSQDISDTTMFDRNLLINYFFFRLLIQNSKFIPKSQSSSNYVKMVQSAGFDLGIQKHLRRDRGRPDPFAGDDEQTRMACARQTMEMMTFANARVFTELLYPTQEDSQNIRKATNKLVQSIRHSYRGMMDELSWLDDSSRKGAFAKVDDMQVNLAFPDYIMDNEQLDKTYETLSINKQDDTYYTALEKLTVYNQQQQYKQLLGSVDRSYFVGPPSTVNAWYAPEFNSITFPEGILREPWFNPDWPASINYGGLGVVAGHEVSHAFDDGGVQWTSLGGLNSWMSETSQQSFQKMAQCVVEEYSGFQVLDASKYTPNKVNGDNTQGENIADNAGIHASFRAYRNHIALNGPDPQLPDRTFGQITHDQLFFLSFAQTWCQAPPTDEELFQQILVDPHAPSYNRVFGTVQNYPAFRSAFNCPVGTAYAPKEHCHVWTPVN